MSPFRRAWMYIRPASVSRVQGARVLLSRNSILETKVACGQDNKPAGGDPNKDINRAYALVRKVLADLGGSMTQGVRDSDIKRRMLVYLRPDAVERAIREIESLLRG